MPGGPGSGRVPASPPIGFPVYGLDLSWPGVRWLEVFGDEIGDPPRWVSLGHRSLDDSLIMVKTYARLATGTPRSFHGTYRRSPPTAVFGHRDNRPDLILIGVGAGARLIAVRPWQSARAGDTGFIGPVHSAAR
jgi:hypothetical protein